MEEPLITPPQEEAKKKKPSRLARKVLAGIGIGLLGWLIWSVVSVYMTPDRNIQQIYLVPDDAALIIQSAHPKADWETFSRSDAWTTLRQAKAFAGIAAHATALDSILRSNDALLSLVGRRDMLISLHRTRARDWDALIILDMQKTSKLNLLKNQIELLLKVTDYTVTQRTYNGITLLEMRDPATRDILYAAFVENHFVASYTSRLVEKAIDVRHAPGIGLEAAYIDVEKLVAGKGLYRLFVHYARLPEFLSIYLSAPNEYLDAFCRSMDFAGLWFDPGRDRMELQGTTLRRDTADPYVDALLRSGAGRMKAHEILSARTALYTNISLKDPLAFTRQLEAILREKEPAAWQAFADQRQRIESYFDLSLEKHFLGWMSGEFALTQSEPGLLGREPERILAIRAKDIKNAREQMDYIGKRVRRKSPLRIESVDYKGFEVHYVEMKGFFRLFFGGLFERFEKPYYTFIDDYVVFSNQPSSLLSFIEDYEQKNLLAAGDGFREALGRASTTSTIFLYADIHKFYPQLQTMLAPDRWRDLQADRRVLYSFPRWTMQIIGSDASATLRLQADYRPYAEETVATGSDAADAADPGMDASAESETELMGELRRFYVEKFQGNILREFYPGGELLSEAEVKDGRRHGRYREYYESGALKVRGKFTANRPRGTWKYYTPDGRFDRKEKF